MQIQQGHRGNMDNLQLLVIFVFSAAAVTGFQLSSSFDVSRTEDSLNSASRTILSRYRRDTDHELAHSAAMCCNEPKPERVITEKGKECMQEASTKLSVTVTEDMLLPHMDSNETACFLDCRLRQNNALDNGGQIILKAAIEGLAECPGFKDQSLLDKVTTICANLPAANGGAPGQTYVCNQAALQFVRCAHDVKVFNCPVEYQIQSATCTKVWEEINAKKP